MRKAESNTFLLLTIHHRPRSAIYRGALDQRHVALVSDIISEDITNIVKNEPLVIKRNTTADVSRDISILKVTVNIIEASNDYLVAL